NYSFLEHPRYLVSFATRWPAARRENSRPRSPQPVQRNPRANPRRIRVGCDKRSAVALGPCRTWCDCAALVTPYEQRPAHAGWESVMKRLAGIFAAIAVVVLVAWSRTDSPPPTAVSKNGLRIDEPAQNPWSHLR